MTIDWTQLSEWKRIQKILYDNIFLENSFPDMIMRVEATGLPYLGEKPAKVGRKLKLSTSIHNLGVIVGNRNDFFSPDQSTLILQICV